MNTLLSAIILGGLGRLSVSGKQNHSMMVTIVVGIVAALIGTLLARLFRVTDTGGVDWVEHLAQVVLAAVGSLLSAVVALCAGPVTLPVIDS